LKRGLFVLTFTEEGHLSTTPRRSAVLHLELTSFETETLREVLKSYLADLHLEIAHTDSADFRDMLRERQRVLTKVHASLASVPSRA
jgi:hypothetical protein